MARFPVIWLETTERQTLVAGDVHVWLVDLNQAEPALPVLKRTLTADEIDRANRFGFEQHRRHFIVRRGVLRCLLSRYLDEAPSQIRFQYGPQGKPSLSDPSSPQLFFNLSHSGEIILYAFSRSANLGIDVEHIRPLEAASQLVHWYFSRNEARAYCSLSTEEEKKLAFFRGWTRKEAFLKATGEGLTIPLDQVEVPLGVHETVQFLSLPASIKPEATWQLVDLQLHPGYCGALALNGVIRQVSYLR